MTRDHRGPSSSTGHRLELILDELDSLEVVRWRKHPPWRCTRTNRASATAGAATHTGRVALIESARTMAASRGSISGHRNRHHEQPHGAAFSDRSCHVAQEPVVGALHHRLAVHRGRHVELCADGWPAAGVWDGAVELELWQQGAAIAPHQTQWAWVKGHAGHPQNEYANHLAIRAATNQDHSDGLVVSQFEPWWAEQQARGKGATPLSPFPMAEQFVPAPALPPLPPLPVSRLEQ